eukprot:NODE_45_length_27728_cov_0.328387.p11 type:complete len:220 gc:universal NODE_45_length_27728_cov_0.328387:4878-5537(+)
MKQWYKNPFKFSKPSLFRSLLSSMIEKPMQEIGLRYTLGSYFPNEFIQGASRVIPLVLNPEFDGEIFTEHMKDIVPIKMNILDYHNVCVHNFRFNIGSPESFDSDKYGIAVNPADFSIMTFEKINGFPNFQERMAKSDGVDIQLIVDVKCNATLSGKKDEVDVYLKGSELIVSFASPTYRSNQLKKDMDIPNWKICDFQYFNLNRIISKHRGTEDSDSY